MDNLKAVEKALKKSSINGMLQCNDRQCNTCTRAALKEIESPRKADSSGSNSTKLLNDLHYPGVQRSLQKILDGLEYSANNKGYHNDVNNAAKHDLETLRRALGI